MPHSQIGVLLAEDCKITRSCTAKFLTLAGFSVLEAENGRHALNLYQKHRQATALIVTDLMMPLMNGDQLCQIVHQYDEKMPIILVSGSERIAPSQTPATNGFFASFRKPVDYPLLIDTANQATSSVL